VINSVLFGKYRNRTEFTDTEFPRYRVSLGTDRYQFPEEPNLHRYRRTEPNRTEVPNAQVYCRPQSYSFRWHLTVWQAAKTFRIRSVECLLPKSAIYNVPERPGEGSRPQGVTESRRVQDGSAPCRRVEPETRKRRTPRLDSTMKRSGGSADQLIISSSIITSSADQALAPRFFFLNRFLIQINYFRLLFFQQLLSEKVSFYEKQ
jgi:hypothetical protein